MPATRTPRKMTARELEAARARVRDQFFAPYQAAQQFGLQLPGMLRGIGKEALGAFRAGTEYVLDPNTQKDVPKDINRVGKAAAQNLGSYLDIFNSVYQAIDNEGMVAKPDYYRNLIGGMYQERFKPEPGDPRLERAASFYADPLVVAGAGGRAARGLADPALYRQIADELGGANRAYAIENLYHGSPHTFDRFDLSKIGTGEGAQAYGHGAYLAESPDVADAYRKKLSADRFSLSEESTKGNILSAELRDVVAEKKSLKGMEDFSPRAGARIKELSEKEAVLTSEIQRLAKISNEQMAGNMYQTRLAWPDPAREAATPLKPEDFLDWDKPLSEQSPMVRGALDDAIKKMPEHRQELFNQYPLQDFQQGKDIKEMIGDYYLQQAGIPGIRYLDAGSRPANVVDKRLYDLYEKYGDVNRAVDEMMKSVYNTPKVKKQMREGYIKQLNESKQTRNYVVFDDKLIDIVARNNQPIKKAEAPQANVVGQNNEPWYMKKYNYQPQIDAVNSSPMTSYFSPEDVKKALDYASSTEGIRSWENVPAMRATINAISSEARKLGWKIKKSKSGSNYLTKNGLIVRLSDHSLPMQGSRNRADNYSHEIVVRDWTKRDLQSYIDEINELEMD